VILSGMGQDGLKGSEEITRAGGRVLVQDEASSVVWEIGGLVVNAGLADAVVPLAQVATELQRRTERSGADDRRAVAAGSRF